MKCSAAVFARCAKSLTTCLLLASTFAVGDPVEWTNTVGGAWSLADNWSGGIAPDAADAAVLFGSAVTAPAAVALDGPRIVGDMTFNSANAYTLTGSPLTLNKSSGTSVLQVNQGSHTVASDINSTSTVLSVVTDPGASLALAGSLSGTSTNRLEKTGTGTLNLSGYSSLFAGAVAANQGSLALQGVTLPGALSVASPGAVSVLPATTNGLMGFYYNVTPNSANFSSLAAMETHFATLTPNLAAPSILAGSTFDFGATGEYFPLPYALGGSQSNNFEAVYRGTLTVPAGNYYTFRVTHDDGFLLAIDGKMIVNRLTNTTTDGTLFLEAGPHNIVLGFFQGTGDRWLRVQVKVLNGSFAMLPNTWLTPYTTVGALSGNGAVAVAANAQLNVAQNTSSTFTGELSGPAGSRFIKNGIGNLILSPAASTVSNAFEGDVSVQGGVLALTTAERISDATTATIGSGADLQLAADETLAALSGAGALTLGGASAVTVGTFTGDADCGISTNKTYTHLLDFPANASAATVNGVVFTSAAMSGSANGYSWSTAGTVPPSAFPDSGSGLDQLLNDFYYDSTDYTLTISNLRPGQSYETRLYFKNFGNSPRELSFFFTAGAAFAGSVNHNPDTVTRSWVSCRYTADAAGTLSVRIISRVAGHTCHLYALSNEETPPQSVPELSPAPAVSPCVVAFTNDLDSGISLAKSYTHKLDFPNNGNPATVNGVVFLAAGMSGSADGYSWNTVNPPTGQWNDAPNDSTRAGVDRLLWDFFYNSADYTLTLSGLHPGQTYEVHLYLRSFANPVVANSTRDVTFTFTAGATVIGSVFHDLDTIARSRVDCRYTADTAGTLAIRVLSHSSGDTCHLYAMANEEILAPRTLTLVAPAGRTTRHTGAVNGFGALVKKGEGTQVFGGNNSLPVPLDVQAGTVTFESGSSVNSGAVVRAGAVLEAPNGNVRFGGVEGAGTFSLAGLPAVFPTTNVPAIVFFTDDASTGISASKAYTHLLDFGNGTAAALVNGVQFTKTIAANGDNWANFPPSFHPGGGYDFGIPAVNGNGIHNLLYDMNYGLPSPGSATIQLTGLTPGKRYEVHFYNRSWGWGNDRTQTMTFDPDGDGPISEAITFNPDALLPNFVAYRYTASLSAVLNITVQAPGNNQSLHLYGLSNEEINDAIYVPVTVDTARDCVLSGPITGAGAWAKAGAAKFTVTGQSTATGALAITAGAFGVANSGCATSGTVSVAAGALLFGDGRIGGSVTVSSNAWLMAGTASACGTLQVGGSLALAQGVRLAYRFGTGVNDTVTVGGTLTFPASGVVQASAITTGVPVPSRGVFFSSAETIVGPADLTGWTVEGVVKSHLKYSEDRKAIYFVSLRGMMILVL